MMRIYNPTISLAEKIISFIFECQKKSKDITENDIINYLKKSEDYIRKHISFLLEYEIIIRDNEKIKLIEENYSSLNSGNKTFSQILKETLIGIKPFVEYISKLKNGLSTSEAIKLIKFLYDIEDNEKTIQIAFDNWIKVCSLNVKSIPVENKIIKQMQKSLDDKISTNVFLKTILDDNYKFVSQIILDDLSEALLAIKIDTLKAVNDASRALEDFLRIDLAPHVNLTHCSGIGQIVSELNKNIFKLIYPKKLNNICVGLGNVRAMGDAHGVDKDINQRWIVNEESAMFFIFNIIAVINGYLTYREKGLLKF